LKKPIKESRSIFEKHNIHLNLDKINQKILDPNFWKNKTEAEKIIKEKKLYEDLINSYNSSVQECNDCIDLYNLAVEENNKSIINDSLINIKNLQKKVKQNEIKCFLSNETDSLDSYIEIHAGAGGTESQDWAEMLQRMYVRWAESNEFDISLLQESKGEEAGIKSSTLKISGDYVYGRLKRESGIHRLVRISPFDSNKRRHTSFASIWVYPEIDDKVEIEINEGDLRIDTYRASGAGGQHVNKTDSAVRITHIPTHIVVQCQSGRSQHKNKSNAITMLKSRLYELELQKRKEEENKINSEKKDIGWGNQIRSYVLHPYKLIKDLRTNYESSNVSDVLDGNIDKFLEKSLTL